MHAMWMAKALRLEIRELSVPFLAWNDVIDYTPCGWLVLVLGLEGTPLTRPFDTRQQAERYVELTAMRIEVPIPALMLAGLPRIRRIPLYGVGRLADWV